MPEKELSLDTLTARLEASRKQMRKRMPDFQRWEDWYDCILPKEFRVLFQGKYRDRSSLVQPLVRTCINELRAKIVNAVFSVKPHFDIVRWGLPEELLEKNKKLVQLQLWYRSEKYRTKFAEQVLDWLISGIGVKIGRWKKDYDDLTGKLIYEGFGFDNIDYYKFYPSPQRDTDGNLSYFFIQSVYSYQDLLQMEKEGLVEDVGQIELADFGKFQQELDNYDLDVDATKLDLTKEVDKLICPVLVSSYTDRDNKIIIANKKHFIKKGNNWNKSKDLGVSLLNLGKRKSEVVGRSSVDVIEDLFIEKFYLRNRRADEGNLALYSQQMTDDPNAPAMFRAGPGRIHKVPAGMLEHYKAMEFKGSPEKSLGEEALVTQEIKAALRLEDLFMGQSPQRRETATTNLILQENAASEMNFTIGQIEDQIISPDVIMCLKANHQVFPVSPPSAYRGFEIRKDEILYDVGVRALGMTQQTNKSVMAASITGLMEQWKTIPPLAGNVEWIEFAQRQLAALGFPDPDKIIPPSYLKLIPIEKENYMLIRGHFVPVHEEEDHFLHIEHHQGVPNSEEHIAMHEQFLEQKMPNKMRGNLITSEEKLNRQTMARIEPKTQTEGVF